MYSPHAQRMIVHALPVYLTTVADLNDAHDEADIFNLIDDSIISDANPV
jgi:hypothetical protein